IWLEGVATDRPFGAQATLTADVINSSFTLMAPIADQDRFLGLLKDRLQLSPEKTDAGTYKVEVPVINEVHLRFANDYVYLGRTIKDVDPKSIPTPKAFFANDDGAVGSVIVRIDQIPDEVKTFVIGQFELGLNEQRRKNVKKESPVEKAAIDWMTENVSGALKTFLDDAKELRASVYIDDKTDNLSAELTLTAKSGTTLAKNIASLAGKTSIPAAIVGGKGAAVRLTVKAELPAAAKKDLDKVVDAGIEAALKDVPEDQKALAERVLKTIAPSLKSGAIDAAVSFTPRAKGGYTLIVAGAVKKGNDIESLAKDLAKQFGPMIGEAVEFKFDVEKIGSFNLHQVTINAMPPDVQKVFGTNKVWVAASEDYIAVSIEPDGTALRTGLKANPAPVPAFSLEVAGAQLVPLVAKNLNADEVKAVLKDTFGDESPAGKDTLSITATGGDKLSVKGTLKGKVVRMLTSFFMLRKQQ
ncbi:MAG TPA: hypothetical protein VLM40_17360, partial [Gemmata sp.]|nr:hypothetical protein [Gemmata sp.]